MQHFVSSLIREQALQDVKSHHNFLSFPSLRYISFSQANILISVGGMGKL